MSWLLAADTAGAILALPAAVVNLRERARYKKAAARVREAQREAENLALPDGFAEQLAEWAREAETYTQGERFLGRMLADDLRKVLDTVPDRALAALLYEVLVMSGRLCLHPDDPYRLPLLLRTLTVTAVDLTALDRELAS